MATTTATSLASLQLVLVLSMSANLSMSQVSQEFKETKMVLYFQDISGSPNAPVAGIAGKQWTFIQFGTVFLVDDLITENPDPNSAVVGRAEGMFATARLEGRNLHADVSIVFTNEAYNGSTLKIQGNSKQFEAVREHAVLGGRGRFRHARRYATFETFFLDIPATYSIRAVQLFGSSLLASNENCWVYLISLK